MAQNNAIRYMMALVTMVLFGGIAVAIGIGSGTFGSRLFFFLFGLAMLAGFLLGQHVLSRFVK